MDPDLALALGLIVGGFSIPSMLSAVTDGRAPRASALTILIATGLVYYALSVKPGGYTLSQVPDVFFAVLGGFAP